MDAEHEAVYDDAVDEFVRWYDAQMENLSGMAIIAAMQKMRHLVALTKIPATMEYIDEFVEDTDRKLVVFAHHKDVAHIIFDDISNKYGKEFPVLKFAAEMNPADKFATQNKFNESKRAIMVASTQSAGEGLNLQTCSDCILHERQWNPGKEEQAEGRFIRIGSEATSVNAIYAHMNGLTAIDQALDAIVERKRIQFHSLMNNTDAPQWNEESIMKELADSIVRAHKAKKRAA